MKKSFKALFIALVCAYTATLSVLAQGDDTSAPLPPIQAASGNANETKLLEGARSGDLKAVQAAIQEGVDIHCRTTCGENALQIAKKNNYPHIVNHLHIYPYQKICNRALFTAALRGDVEGLNQALLEGANINSTNDFGMTALQVAQANNHQHIAEVLLQLSQGNSRENIKNHLRHTRAKEILFAAAKTGDLDALYRALMEGASIYTYDGTNAFLIAAAWGHEHIVHFLLHRSEGKLNETRDKYGNSALDLAQKYNRQDVIALLSRYEGPNSSAFPTEKFSQQLTEKNNLFVAAETGDLNALYRALMEGASIYDTYNSSNIFIIAAGRGHEHIVHLLLHASKGKMNETCDKYGNSALDLARIFMRKGVTAVLSSYKEPRSSGHSPTTPNATRVNNPSGPVTYVKSSRPGQSSISGVKRPPILQLRQTPPSKRQRTNNQPIEVITIDLDPQELPREEGLLRDSEPNSSILYEGTRPMGAYQRTQQEERPSPPNQPIAIDGIEDDEADNEQTAIDPLEALLEELKEDDEALLTAAKSNRYGDVKTAISCRANPNARNAQGETALHLAVNNRNPHIAQLLLTDLATDHNLANAQGNTALHLAAINDDVDIAGLLLRDFRTNLFLRNNAGETAMDIANRNRNSRVFDLLHQAQIQAQMQQLPPQVQQVPEADADPEALGVDILGDLDFDEDVAAGLNFFL